MRICYPRGSQTRNYSPVDLEIPNDHPKTTTIPSKPQRRFPRIPTTIPIIPNNYPKKRNDLEGQISK